MSWALNLPKVGWYNFLCEITFLISVAKVNYQKYISHLDPESSALNRVTLVVKLFPVDWLKEAGTSFIGSNSLKYCFFFQSQTIEGLFFRRSFLPIPTHGICPLLGIQVKDTFYYQKTIPMQDFKIKNFQPIFSWEDPAKDRFPFCF
jgi:hypothetical protein